MPLSNCNNVKYVYDLPYKERMELCRILDMSDKWEILAGQYMNFDMMTIQALRREVRCSRSPTDELLTRWGHQNHTILELFVHLSKMQHYQAMMAIKQFVDVEYHRLIYEGEENLSRIFKRPSAPPQSENSNLTKTENSVNLNQSNSSNVLPSKMAGVQVFCDSESKILNVDPSSRSRSNSAGNAAQTALVNDHHNDRNGNSPNCRGEPSRCKERSEVSLGVESVGPPMIPFKELEIATNGWDVSAILGKGGFGTVYKGVWKNTAVAVKRTRATETDDNHTVQIQQILGELRMLNAYRHDNILPLYGFSVGGEDPCLIYQFMPNGSLESRLLCRHCTPPLSWGQRLNIAIGTARGLQFLHTINEKPLIHGDIKSANILLDSNFKPKIGDFGLAREGPYSHYTHMKVSRVHGTRPYLPDEFLRAKKFSTKVDTHCFGVVLFELSTGLRAYDDQRSHKFLRDLIENSSEAQLASIIDRKASPEETQTYKSLVDLGKVCVSRKPKDRPEMVLVLQELEAVAAQRDLKLRAQQLAHRNSLTPVSPYELQLLHDQLSHRRGSNASPVLELSHLRVVSPPPDSRATGHVVSTQPDGRVSPRIISATPMMGETRPSGQFAPVSNNGGDVSCVVPSNSSRQATNPFYDGYHVPTLINQDMIPSCLVERVQQVQVAQTVQPVPSVCPIIAISPSSVQTDSFSNPSSATEQVTSVAQAQTPELVEEFQYSCNIPFISALGIKKKESAQPAEDAPEAQQEQSSMDAPTTAKGKSLWILGQSG